MSSENILSLYWDLASTNESIRLKAARELVGFLAEAQGQHVKEGSKDEKLFCSELDYSLNRLSKGLASSRKGARQGFATVLAEILYQFDCVSAENVIKLLAENLQMTGNTKSQEERDAYIGHVFGLMSLVRAQDVKNVKNCDWLKQAVETLKQLSEKKSYLQELCMKSIVDVLSLVTYEVFKQYIEPVIKDYIYEGWETATPSSLLIALAVERQFGDHLDKKIFKTAWKCTPLVDTQNYAEISDVLQESTLVHPKVHCVWDEVILQILQCETSDFDKFWTTVVDEGLFQSTHERKYLGFQLITKILPELKSSQVSTVFSKNVMRSFINNLSSTQSYLHKAAKHLASTMPSALAKNKDQDVSAYIIMQLLGSRGNMLFDKLTNTKTVEMLLGTLQESGVVKLVSWLIQSFIKGSIDGKISDRPSAREVDATRTLILNQLLSLTKTKNLSHTGTWLKQVMFFLVEQTYFKAVAGGAKLKLPLSSHVRQICEQRCLSAMRELDTSSHKNQDKNAGKDEERLMMYAVVRHMKDLLSSKDFTVMSDSWSDKIQKAFDNAVKVIAKIHKKAKDGTANPEDAAFELLLSHMTLQLFTEPDQTIEILKELKACYKNKQDKDDNISTDEPHWVEVLTEILLSLLTRPSSLIRHIVDQVFTAISPHLTKDALEIILQAVDPKSLGGEGDEVLEITEESDDEMNAEGGDGEDMDEKEEESDDSDEEEDEEDEDNNGVDEAFRAEIQAALGSAAVNMDDEGSSDGDDLDDETMMQLDDALSVVFKTRVQASNEKKKKKDTTKTILHFKLRVLDVIEILIKKQPRNPLVLDLLEPLLSLAWSCLNTKDYQTLGERAQGIYRNRLCTMREYPSAEDLNSDELHSKIETLIHKAMTAPSLNIVSLIARGCMLLIRVLRGCSQGQSESTARKRKHTESTAGTPAGENTGLLDVTRVAAVFNEALKDFMEKRSTHLHPVLFMELINRFPFLAWELASVLTHCLEGAVNNFRKTQACIMLAQLLSQKFPTYGNHLRKNAATLQKTLRSILMDSAKTDTQLKAKHLREVLKLITKVVKEVNSLDQPEEIVSTELMREALQSALDGHLASRSQDIKSTCTRLIAMLGGSTSEKPQSKKRKKRKGSTQTNGHSHNTEQHQSSTNKEPQEKEPKKKKRKRKKSQRIEEAAQ